MGPDFEKYRPLLGDFDLSEAQKDDLLKAMWSIMDSFVDRAFGDDPVQQVVCKEAFGKASEKLGVADSDKVKSKNISKKKDYEDLKP